MTSYTTSTRTARTYQYSSDSGPHSQVTETRTFIDADGTKRTETVTYSGDDDTGKTRGGFTKQIKGIGSNIGGWVQDKFDNISNKMDNFHIGARITPAKSKKTEARYNRGWSSIRKPESTSVLPVHPEGKSYDEVRQECLNSNSLFEDPDFPAYDTSIFYSRTPPRPFVWKRPPEICGNPELFVGGASRFDVLQGELGDCWLLAAVACLTTNQELLQKIVPHDQGFGSGQYCGAFHFRFWRFGKWEDVIIDDRLPTYNGKLVFMHSVDNNEFWTALLEKAYAKLHGSYEVLKGGATSEAMEDFTGGVTEMYDFRQNLPPNMFQIMLQAHQRKSLMGCSIEAMPGQMEAELSNGLIMGHAYSITDVRMVSIQTSRMKGKIPMVRVRNPWGNECEWKGSWSDQSQEWKFISESEKRELGLTFGHDGEFWMSFQDFTKNFQKVEICHLGVEGMDDDGKGFWKASNLEGAWHKRVNAGGCRNYLDTFWTNPQYHVEVTDADDEDNENMGTLIVGLMQKNRRKLRKEGLDMLTIGYAIYPLKDASSTDPLDIRYFKYNASVAKSPAFINLREVCGRHRLAPGTYCVIPSTFAPNEEGDFLLRIFSEKPTGTEEMDEDTGMSDVKPTVEVTDEDKRQEDAIREAFRKVAGVDLEIDAYELQDILNAAFMKEFKFDGFSAETCRSMVAMMDVDKSGKLGFDEFKTLWKDLRVWKIMFKQYDTDKSGNLNGYELRSAFHSVGYKISNATFNGLVQRYSHRDGKIYFDDFIHCVVRMKTMFDTYKQMPKSGDKALFGLDEFIQTTMYS